MTLKQPAGYLIWSRGPKGPTAAKAQNLPDKDEYWKSLIIQSVPLDSEHFTLSLDELAQIYPAPADAAQS